MQNDNSIPIRKLYESLNKQDISILDQVISNQVEYIDFTLGVTVKGKDEFVKHFQSWWKAFPNGTGQILNLISAGDQVVVEVLGKGTQTGEFNLSRGSVVASGEHVELHFCQVYRVKDGKIVSGHSYSDAGKLLAAFAPATQKVA